MKRSVNLTLVPASTEGHDALNTDGKTVEIKATTRRSVALQTHGRKPNLLALLRLDPDTLAPTVVYYGPAVPVWDVAGKPQKNGQRRVSLSKLPPDRPQRHICSLIRSHISPELGGTSLDVGHPLGACDGLIGCRAIGRLWQQNAWMSSSPPL